MSRMISILLLLLVGLSGTAAAQRKSPANDPVRGGDSVGLAAGLNTWPADLYCRGPMTATVQPLEPSELLDRIRLAAKCGVRLVLVPPRRFLTVNQKTKGVFSVDNAERLTDRYAEELPPDTLRK